MSDNAALRCQTCSAALTHEVRAFAALPRVTSDSRTFAPGGRLFVCRECGTVQKSADSTWLEEIAGIYAAYDMYHQSASNDQAVFDGMASVST